MKLINADCEQWLLKNGRMDGWVCFMDPPDNLGLAYDGYRDKRDDYYDWLCRVICLALDRFEIVWVSYYWKHDLELKARLYDRVVGREKTFIWRYKFGQYRTDDCGSGFRFLWRLGNRKIDPDFKIVSERMKIGDHRACLDGRVPDDVWEFPRNRNRISWHPTQHPQGVMERILRMYRLPVVDLFAGSGTTFRAAHALKLDCIGIEQSSYYCRRMMNSIAYLDKESDLVI